MPSQAMTVEVVVHPASVQAGRLPALLEAIRDYSPILQTVGEVIEQELSENFTTQGFGDWAPLANSTVKERFRKGYGPNQPLVRTAKLKDALTIRDAPGHKFLVGPSGIVVGLIGEVVPYGSVLDRGNPAKRLPARALIQVRAETRERLIQIIQEWLVGKAGNSEAVSVYVGTPLTA